MLRIGIKEPEPNDIRIFSSCTWHISNCGSRLFRISMSLCGMFQQIVCIVCILLVGSAPLHGNSMSLHLETCHVASSLQVQLALLFAISSMT